VQRLGTSYELAPRTEDDDSIASAFCRHDEDIVAVSALITAETAMRVRGGLGELEGIVRTGALPSHMPAGQGCTVTYRDAVARSTRR
jgi:hypothetical protein